MRPEDAREQYRLLYSRLQQLEQAWESCPYLPEADTVRLLRSSIAETLDQEELKLDLFHDISGIMVSLNNAYSNAMEMNHIADVAAPSTSHAGRSGIMELTMTGVDMLMADLCGELKTGEKWRGISTSSTMQDYSVSSEYQFMTVPDLVRFSHRALAAMPHEAGHMIISWLQEANKDVVTRINEINEQTYEGDAAQEVFHQILQMPAPYIVKLIGALEFYLLTAFGDYEGAATEIVADLIAYMICPLFGLCFQHVYSEEDALLHLDARYKLGHLVAERLRWSREWVRLIPEAKEPDDPVYEAVVDLAEEMQIEEIWAELGELFSRSPRFMADAATYQQAERLCRQLEGDELPIQVSGRELLVASMLASGEVTYQTFLSLAYGQIA